MAAGHTEGVVFALTIFASFNSSRTSLLTARRCPMLTGMLELGDNASKQWAQPHVMQQNNPRLCPSTCKASTCARVQKPKGAEPFGPAPPGLDKEEFMKKSLVIDYWPLACTSVTSAVNVRSVRSLTTVKVTVSPGFNLLT